MCLPRRNGRCTVSGYQSDRPVAFSMNFFVCCSHARPREIKFSARSVRSFVRSVFSSYRFQVDILVSVDLLILFTDNHASLRHSLVYFVIATRGTLFAARGLHAVRSRTHVSAEFNRNSAGVTLFPLIWISLVF